jgi:DNA-binding NtrC family response regulator
MKKKILIVDDEPNLLSIYKKLLSTDYIDIYTAETFEEAIAHINKNNFDALITDLNLTPKLQKEGLKLIDALKKKNKDAICILITAFENIETKMNAYDIGASYCFQKPVSSLILKESLERAGIYKPNNEKSKSIYS